MRCPTHPRSCCVLMALMALPCAGGCTKRHYEARHIVMFEDLGSDRQEMDKAGYRIDAEEAATGGFPTALTVARVQVRDTACLPDERRLEFRSLTGKDGPPWLELAQDMPWIGKVFFLQPTDFPRDDIQARDVVKKAGDFGAGLCLVYAESDLLCGEVRVIGVLYATQTAQPVATITAIEKPRQHGYEIDPPRDQVKEDARGVTPRYRAIESFRLLVHDCVLELIERQGPADTRISAAAEGAATDPVP